VTTLMRAAALGDARLVAHSLDTSRSALDAVDAQGRTALMLAARAGHDEIVRALLGAGADADACDCDGADAVALATAHGCTTAATLVAAERAKRVALLDVICGRKPAAAHAAAGAPRGGLPAGFPAGLADLAGQFALGASGERVVRESPF
jgi:hypothetical protein